MSTGETRLYLVGRACSKVQRKKQLAKPVLHPAMLHRNEIRHSQRERTVILQDVRADPSLPRTKDVECPNPSCLNHEAVFFSASTEEGMTLFFNCTACGHRWRDAV